MAFLFKWEANDSQFQMFQQVHYERSFAKAFNTFQLQDKKIKLDW